MEDRNYETFDNDQDDLVLRALYVEDMPVEFEGEDPYVDDIYIWFAAKNGDNHWWAFGLSDELDEPEVMLDGVDEEELRKTAIYLGENWDVLHSDCPHCVIARHRENKRGMPEQLIEDILATEDNRLAELRDIGRWQATANMVESMSGLKLGLN